MKYKINIHQGQRNKYTSKDTKEQKYYKKNIVSYRTIKGALYYRSMASEASTAGVSLMDSYGHH